MIGRSNGYWGLLNPSLYWLPFGLPFLAYGVGGHLIWWIGILVTALATLLLYYQKDRPFSMLFYLLPLGALFATYVVRVEKAFIWLMIADLWLNLALFFPNGRNGHRIQESLFSARLLGLFAMLYTTILLMSEVDFVGDRVILGWIPFGMLFTLYVVHSIRNYILCSQEEVRTLLPIVRVAVVKGETLFIQKRNDERYDIPFCFKVQVGEVPYTIAEEEMARYSTQAPRFLLKYKECLKGGERVVYLFVINLRHHDTFELDCKALEGGQFVRIVEVSKDSLAPLLCEECAYLTSTIFRTNRLLSRL